MEPMRRRPDVVIRLIGLFKLVKALMLVTVGVGALSMQSDDSWAQVALHALAADAHGRRITEAIARIAALDAHQLRQIGVGSLLYAAVFVVEGIGLLLRRGWAEVMTVIVTVSFIPLEIYELAVHHRSWAKAAVIVVNVLVVIYLVRRLRREHHWPFRR
jgi:uncharacterized membrane protein (DUF2068 family)